MRPEGFSEARSKALDNLRQMGSAWVLSSPDYNERVVPNTEDAADIDGEGSVKLL